MPHLWGDARPMAHQGEAQVDPARLFSLSCPLGQDQELQTFTPCRVLMTPGLSLLGLY